MSSRGGIARAAGVMSLATFISRILGYVKDMILATFFGASAAADVFFVAFRIPNLLRELFAEGSMSSAFVPVLTEYQTKQGREEANRLVRATFVTIFLIVGFVCLLGIIFAPAIVSVIAPGFIGDHEKFSTAVLLTRIMFPFLLFISLAAATMGALNTRGVFFIPALAPALLNVVTIVCVVALSAQFADPIVSVAIGVALGGFVQFLFQLPAFFRQGYSLVPGEKRKQGPRQRETIRSALCHPGLKKIGRLIIPSTAGLAVAQINIFVSTILASYLAVGSITYLYYSMRLIQFPIGIFGVAMGMAVLPALSQHAVRGEMNLLREDFSFALRLLFFITVPAMAGLIALKVPIVNILFQRGEFGYEATVGTSDALMFYAFGIWAIVGVRVLASAFYSLQDTKTPVKIAVAAMVTNVVLSLLLMGPLQHKGLAFANSLASVCNFSLLFYFLRRRLGSLGSGGIALSFLKTSVASAVMGIAGWFILRGDVWIASGNVIYKTAALGGTIAACLVLYGALSYLLKSEELLYLIRKVKERAAR